MAKLIHQTGGSNLWTTPHFLFNHYDSIYHFELDAAADDENALIQEWSSSNWLNCPFSPNSLQKQFIQKAVKEACLGKTTVCLIPSRTETKIWQELVFPFASIIYFLDERLHYSYCENPSGYPSSIVVFDKIAKARTFNADDAFIIQGEVRRLKLSYLTGYTEYKEKIKANQKIADAEKTLIQNRLDHGVIF